MKKKKIFLYNNFLKFIFIVSIVFIDYLFIWGIIHEGISFEYLLVILIMSIFTIFIFISIFSHYITLDKDKNKIKVSLSISNINKITKPLDSIKDIYLERKDNGFHIVLVYKYGEYHENVFYRFHRFSFIEKAQLKRISKELLKCKANFL